MAVTAPYQDLANPSSLHRRLPSLSFFFPIYNEQENFLHVYTTLTRLGALLAQKYEIIIVNDGSQDNSGALADQIAESDLHVHVYHHAKNLGYGAAVKTGLRQCQSDYIFWTDGDGQFDYSQLEHFVSKMPAYDLVIGRRKNRQDSMYRNVLSKIGNRLARFIFKIPTHDVGCAFKLFKNTLKDHTFISHGAMINTEFIWLAQRHGFKILEQPVHHFPRPRGKSTGGKCAVIARTLLETWKLKNSIF